MAFLDKLINGLNGISVRLVWLSGALLILAAFIVFVDVVTRKIFNITMAGADELSGYALGISIMLSLSYALLNRSNIRIDAAYQHMPAPLRAALDLLGLFLLTAFIGYVAWRGWFLIADTYEHGSHSITPLRTPLALPQTPWFVGMIFAVFTGIVLMVAGVVGFAKRDWPYVNKLLGIPSVDEQIEEETRQ